MVSVWATVLSVKNSTKSQGQNNFMATKACWGGGILPPYRFERINDGVFLAFSLSTRKLLGNYFLLYS